MSEIPATMTYDTLVKSGAIRDKSSIERAFERLRSSGDKAEFHALEAAKGVRQVGESGVVGAILGALHSKLKTGLDVAPPGAAVGTVGALGVVAPTKVPLDGVIMALGFVGGVFLADEPSGVGKTLMNASAAASAVFMFRQSNDLLTKMSIKASGITPGGGAQLPNAQAAAVQPGVISKASFAGENSRAYGSGFHAMSRLSVGEDPIVAMARGMR